MREKYSQIMGEKHGKMFDKLIILDTGGYLIYNGNPVDSIEYFKRKIEQANYNESECYVCGNVNPEQIFDYLMFLHVTR